MMAPERKYALTRISPGDYLLPSNDAATIWRIAKYRDGPSFGITDRARDRTWWGVWKVRHRATPHDVLSLDWEHWTMEEGSLPTRKEAIDAALRLSSSSIRRSA